MASRRKRGLGSPPNAHIARAAHEYGVFRDATTLANIRLNNNDCNGAMAQLKRASISAGAAASEAAGGVGSTKAMKPEFAKLTVLTERFKKVCLKSPAEIKHLAKKRRQRDRRHHRR